MKIEIDLNNYIEIYGNTRAFNFEEITPANINTIGNIIGGVLCENVRYTNFCIVTNTRAVNIFENEFNVDGVKNGLSEKRLYTKEINNQSDFIEYFLNSLLENDFIFKKENITAIYFNIKE